MSQQSPVTMYTTEVCPYCLRAKALLKARGVTAIDEVRVDRDPVARIAMIERTGRRTVPQIFIAGAQAEVDLDLRLALLEQDLR